MSSFQPCAHASPMLLYITIAILFAYTILLIAFFMGWCTLIPTRCHPRKEIPFSSVRSPRRNTKFVEIDSVSSSTSLDQLPHIYWKDKKREERERKWERSRDKHKKHSMPTPASLNDYLHPKYSLPPVSIDIVTRKWEFERLLRTPGRHRSESMGDPPLPFFPSSPHDVPTIIVQQA